MKDAVGNELPARYENSIQGRTYIIADKLQKALYELAHIEMDWRNGNDKKENMLRRMRDVQEIVMQAKMEISGQEDGVEIKKVAQIGPSGHPDQKGDGQMNGYPGIRYFLHDGGVYVVPHYTNASDLATMLNLAREAAHRDMKQIGADHAIYGVKHYDPETDLLLEADIYAPAVLLDDDEFTKRTDSETKRHPGSLILALHAMK